MSGFYISGEEIRGLSNVLMEGWEFERDTDSPEPHLLIAKGSWGGTVRTYVVGLNEDHELVGVILMGQYPHGHEKARQDNPSSWEVIDLESGQPVLNGNKEPIKYVNRQFAFYAAGERNREG